MSDPLPRPKHLRRPAEELLPEVYDELRRLASGILRRENVGHTLEPTALVHEVYLRLADKDAGMVKDRTHILALGAGAMRRILVDHARGKNRDKRGAGAQRLTLVEDQHAAGLGDVDLLHLEDALGQLGELNARHARVVELRIFGGLQVSQVAQELGVSEPTIARDWRAASAWLSAALGTDTE